MNRQDAKSAKEASVTTGRGKEIGAIMAPRVEPSRELDALANAVIGAAIEVHRNLGPGYLESMYEEALAVELELRGIPFERQKRIAVDYKGREIGEGRLDLVVGEELLVELKAVDSLAPIHKAQVLSYLKATGCRLGILINFNVPVLRSGIQRVVRS
jgi:GxxExxY protein